MLPLEPKNQLLFIWECMCGWIQKQLTQGNGVTAKNFGQLLFRTSPFRNPTLGISHLQKVTCAWPQLGDKRNHEKQRW